MRRWKRPEGAGSSTLPRYSTGADFGRGRPTGRSARMPAALRRESRLKFPALSASKRSVSGSALSVGGAPRNPRRSRRAPATTPSVSRGSAPSLPSESRAWRARAGRLFRYPGPTASGQEQSAVRPAIVAAQRRMFARFRLPTATRRPPDPPEKSSGGLSRSEWRRRRRSDGRPRCWTGCSTMPTS